MPARHWLHHAACKPWPSSIPIIYNLVEIYHSALAEERKKRKRRKSPTIARSVDKVIAFPLLFYLLYDETVESFIHNPLNSNQIENFKTQYGCLSDPGRSLPSFIIFLQIGYSVL